ncbi:hypothetical protein [Magnetospirillum fulvum]|uniref:hypothetical protein n=1 Tax=Magnetospirillum fulvum TaxID=1082 RepID=UPI0018C8DC5F|nr:hypothetical protein [Magnetospirillum fulvum]
MSPPPRVAAEPKARPRRRPPRRKKRPHRLRLWRDRLVRVWRGINRVPPLILTAVLLTVLANVIIGINIAHWVIRKPTELLLPVSDHFVKSPEETWESYDDLFRRFSTAAISPEMLAALAQVESAGNPAAHTYWRWDVEAPDLFGIYRPASSSVGMYQMTEPAYAEAERFCIRDHRVMTAGTGAESCRPAGGYSRVLPAHAVELTAIYLDRAVARVLGDRPGRSATPQQKQDTAALVHLCGPTVAKRFAQGGFRLTPGETCGDHDPADYLAQVNALARRFKTLAAK